MIKIISANGIFIAKCYGFEAEYSVEHWWAVGNRVAVDIAVAAHILKGHAGELIPVSKPYPSLPNVGASDEDNHR